MKMLFKYLGPTTNNLTQDAKYPGKILETDEHRRVRTVKLYLEGKNPIILHNVGLKVVKPVSEGAADVSE